MNRAISVCLFILLFVSCQETSNNDAIEDIPVTLPDPIKDGPFDLSTIAQNWVQLTVLYGDSVLLTAGDEVFTYRFEPLAGGWKLVEQSEYEASDMFVKSAELKDGNLLLDLDASAMGYDADEEFIMSLLNYSNEATTIVWQCADYEPRIFVNEKGAANYKEYKNHCYDHNVYCPLENPNFGKTQDIPKEQLILPGRSVGKITYLTDKEALNSIFKGNRFEFDASNRDWPITHVIKDNDVDIAVTWNENKQLPYSITISGENSNYKTKEGIGIGSSIEDVETAFWSLFYISGFEIDNEIQGKLGKWNNPDHDQISFKFKMTEDLPQEEYEEIMGSELIASNHYLLRKAGLVVEAITIYFTDPQNIGEKIYDKKELLIFDNKAFYKGEKLYDGTEDLLALIEAEYSEDCPVDYMYDYNPLSLVGDFLSYELNEYGSIACGYSGQSVAVNTINYKTKKAVAIDDVFTTESILTALKNDSWILGQAEMYEEDLGSYDSIDELLSFVEDLHVDIEKENFTIKKFKDGGNLVEVQLVGFKTNPSMPIEKVVLGLTLEPLDKDLAKRSSFLLGTFNSFIYKKH
ncbi:MAG: hypothetical protein GQ574_15915 [Crocinitomix sp.]|nr:hypothetical protein [Crocinitomix sp.]